MPPSAGRVGFGRKRLHDGGENQKALRRILDDTPRLRLRRPWDRAGDPANLGFLIDATFSDRIRCVYGFSTPMRRRNASQ